MTINRRGTDINQFYGFELQPLFIPIKKRAIYGSFFQQLKDVEAYATNISACITTSLFTELEIKQAASDF